MTENTSNEQARKLLAKYLEGACTAEEERLVIQWFYNLDNEPAISEEQKKEALGRSKSNLMRKIEAESASAPIPLQARSRWKIWAIAASLVMALTTTAIMIRKANTTTSIKLAELTEDSSGRYKNDVLPGSHYANLIYPDGQKLALEQKEDDLKNYSKNIEGQLRLEVPAAGTYQLTLSDGTKVWLNSSSALHYPNEFAEGERRVKLTGEAFFEVAKDSRRPFRIEVENSVIEVLGTSFNVNAYKHEVSTSLVEGKVKILNNGKETYLTPGKEAIIKATEVAVHTTDLAKSTAWQRGEFYFDSSDLGEIFEQIGRWYNVEFVGLADIKISNTYAGSISRESKLSEVLNILSYVTNRQFEIDGREIHIK